MKFAMHQNQQIVLDQVAREHYQRVYLQGKNGELTCPVCTEKVRLFLGIQENPHFYHIKSPEKSCPEPVIEDIEPVFVERNGFRIPQGRTLIAKPKSICLFRSAKSIACSIPFKKTESTNHLEQDFYLGKLAANGVILDKSQAAAVVETEGSLLVLAGAGSGKTRVLTARTAYMLDVKEIDPRTVMLVTFTSKAAGEMKNRLLSYPEMKKDQINQLVTGTFHSIFYRILMFHEGRNWSSDRLLKKDWQRDKILKEAGKELELSEKEFAYDLALQQIGFWKNSLLFPT